MYSDACEGTLIKTNDYMSEFGISERTFRRYINEVNIFLAEMYKNQELTYVKSLKGYTILDY